MFCTGTFVVSYCMVFDDLFYKNFSRNRTFEILSRKGIKTPKDSCLNYNQTKCLMHKNHTHTIHPWKFQVQQCSPNPVAATGR